MNTYKYCALFVHGFRLYIVFMLYMMNIKNWFLWCFLSVLSSWNRFVEEWSWSGSNRWPSECKSDALPTELQPQFKIYVYISIVYTYTFICRSILHQRLSIQCTAHKGMPAMQAKTPLWISNSKNENSNFNVFIF